ncbi:MAG: flagellar basal body rod protein FlgC [Planctomycetota bacterium]
MMELDGLFTGMSIASSGLGAERQRLDVIARNIANANVVGTPGQAPYRRQEVVFKTILDREARRGDGIAGQVTVSEVVDDEETPLREVFDPSHPNADKDTGIVTYSNVNMAFEMVDLMSASRAYDANLKAIQAYRDMATAALRLLEG